MRSFKLLILTGAIFISGVIFAQFVGSLFSGKNLSIAQDEVSGISEPDETVKQQEQQWQKKREQEYKQQVNQKQQFLEQQQEQLRTIGEQAAQKRRQIEEDYLEKCKIMQTWIAKATESLEPYEKMAWAELTQKLKHTITVTSQKETKTYYRPPNYGNYVESTGNSTTTAESYVVGNPAQEYVQRQKEIIDARNDMLRNYQQEFANLEKQRQYDLTEVDNWEQSQKNNIVNSTDAKIAKLQSNRLITSIMFSEDNPSIVFGNKIIKHEGDTIGGATIKEIYQDRVDFVKNEKKWTQKIREAPGPEWYQ